jgi:serine/threonine protein phosphatase PrpC
LRILGTTDIGSVRKTNQDAFATGTFDDGSVWAVVCDGMGGANGGGVASTIAVKIISERLTSGYRSKTDANSIRNMLLCAIEAANAEVYRRAHTDKDLLGMGTTVVTVIVTSGKVYVIHIGDSRVYLSCKDNICRLTRDHSIVQEMIETGQITEQEARNHPRKNIITRALGVQETTGSDYCETQISDDDAILICTDGLSNNISDEAIQEVIRTNGDINELVRLANLSGGTDNITVVLISKNPKME